MTTDPRLRAARTGPTIDPTTKIVIVLQAGTESHEGRARALHSVLYAKELADAGAMVRLVFDGAGTAWLARWLRSDGPPSRAAAVFAELKAGGLAYEVCDYCAGAFDVRDELLEHGEALSGAFLDHPSIASLVAEGFQVWIL